MKRSELRTGSYVYAPWDGTYWVGKVLKTKKSLYGFKISGVRVDGKCNITSTYPLVIDSNALVTLFNRDDVKAYPVKNFKSLKDGQKFKDMIDTEWKRARNAQ